MCKDDLCKWFHLLNIYSTSCAAQGVVGGERDGEVGGGGQGEGEGAQSVGYFSRIRVEQRENSLIILNIASDSACPRTLIWPGHNFIMLFFADMNSS